MSLVPLLVAVQSPHYSLLITHYSLLLIKKAPGQRAEGRRLYGKLTCLVFFFLGQMSLYYSLLITYYSLLITYYLLLITYYFFNLVNNRFTNF
ncbi:MAG: hypothetical protein F6K47_04565 [Symploca sp. SIO2E6]|nr:hypothetical protein [Symploca sp. SIO2E6]